MDPIPSHEYLLEQGTRNFNLRRYVDAIEDFSRLIEVSPRHHAAHLSRAVALQMSGRAGEALRDLQTAIELDPNSAATRLQAAKLLCSMGRWDEAWDQLRAAQGLNPPTREVSELRSDLFELQFEIQCRQGRRLEAFSSLRKAAGSASNPVRFLIKQARTLISLGDPSAALDILRDAVASSPFEWEVYELQAVALSQSGFREQAIGSVEMGLSLEPGSPRRRLAAAKRLLELGEFKSALEHVRRALGQDPGSLEARALLGKVSLWLGDWIGAARHADALTAAGPDRPEGYSLRGAALVMLGRPGEALEDLDRAVRLAPGDMESCIWRGEARRLLGRYSEALQDLDKVIRAKETSIAARINRALVLSEMEPEGQAWRDEANEVFDKASGLLRQSGPSAKGWVPAEARKTLLELLRKLQGNRAHPATCVVEENGARRLRPLIFEPTPRALARDIQARIRWRSFEDVMKQFADLLVRFPDVPTVYCHRGEVQLWVGSYREAREDFSRALKLDPGTRWAYIGLCAVEVMEGRPARALEWCEQALSRNPIPGRTMHTYRGEAYRHLGRLEESERELRLALGLDPQRLGAAINLALALGARGDPKGQAAILGSLRPKAANLFRDAAAELGISASPDPDSLNPDTARNWLEKALEMMRGNRSSCVFIYFNRSGQMKEVVGSEGGGEAWN